MALELQRESTEYIYLGVTGSVPATGAELAFLPAGTRPQSSDWQASVLVPDTSHSLWSDAVASGAQGDYYVAVLIGSYGGNTLVLSAADYQVWLRLSDTTEQPVRIAPVSLTVA